MKDMNAIINKKIINKETNEVRLVVRIDEENRKIFSVPESDTAAEPTCMAAATYDRRWTTHDEPVVETPVENKAAEPTTETPVEDKPVEPTTETPVEDAAPVEPMKMSETITALENIFDKLNELYFENKLPKPVITVQSTPKFYGHCSVKKIWKNDNEGMYEINLGAEFINRTTDNTCSTLLHEMIHLFCNENKIADTCQRGRYHNNAFKAEAEARDLLVEYDRANGFAYTKPTDALRAKLTAASIDLNIRFARIMPKAKEKAEREKAHKYVCPICGQEVRTTSDLSLICGVCEVPMERED